MSKKNANCGNAADRVDALAFDALANVSKMKEKPLTNELKVDLENIENDLKKITMDNHKPQ
jgi:hypothetical protein